jgi:hypothetical protein
VAQRPERRPRAAQMVRCEEYRGAAGGGAQGAQPFSVSVTPAALLAMDFHAHLSDHEVIGMLGGTFDAATRSMRCAGPPRGILRTQQQYVALAHGQPLYCIYSARCRGS